MQSIKLIGTTVNLGNTHNGLIIQENKIKDPDPDTTTDAQSG